MTTKLAVLTENQKDFLNFLKSKYSLFHLSNVFFRDLHYGVMAYFELKGVRHRYSEAEDVTHQLVELWQSQELLRKIDARAFMLNYPDFKKPLTKPAPPAKPAAKPAPQAQPAAGTKPGPAPAKPSSSAAPAPDKENESPKPATEETPKS